MESRERRLRRLAMRSHRRGIREMDLILGAFARDGLAQLQEPELDRYERLLEESDHDLYAWVAGTAAPPEEHRELIARIARFPVGLT